MFVFLWTIPEVITGNSSMDMITLKMFFIEEKNCHTIGRSPSPEIIYRLVVHVITFEPERSLQMHLRLQLLDFNIKRFSCIIWGGCV